HGLRGGHWRTLDDVELIIVAENHYSWSRLFRTHLLQFGKLGCGVVTFRRSLSDLERLSINEVARVVGNFTNHVLRRLLGEREPAACCGQDDSCEPYRDLRVFRHSHSTSSRGQECTGPIHTGTARLKHTARLPAGPIV